MWRHVFGALDGLRKLLRNSVTSFAFREFFAPQTSFPVAVGRHWHLSGHGQCLSFFLSLGGTMGHGGLPSGLFKLF